MLNRLCQVTRKHLTTGKTHRHLRICTLETLKSHVHVARVRSFSDCDQLHDVTQRVRRGNEVEDGSKGSVIENFKETLHPRIVTHEFADLTELVAREEKGYVCLHGYLGNWSHLSKRLSFAGLKDPAQRQEIQLISNPTKDDQEASAKHQYFKGIHAHSPVLVKGFLSRRNDKTGVEERDADPKLAQLEISVTGANCGIQVLNDFPVDNVMKDETHFPASQRHLQYRNDVGLRQALELRANIQNVCRAVLSSFNDTIEIETPLLFKSTSEGAREFLVPTRRKGFAYALPQSPQQFKQVLMASGIPGYFQFARCFRDEDLRSDRQPEFTQLDIELGFADSKKVIDLIEKLVRAIWLDILSVSLPQPFPRITYNEAMVRYGSDKPDLRIPIQPFVSVSHLIPGDLVSMLTSIRHPIIDAMVLPFEASPAETRNFISRYLDSMEGKQFQVNPDGAPGVFVYDSSKPLQGLSALGFEAVENLERMLDLEDGHLVILQARKNQVLAGGSTKLGDLRKGIYHAAVEGGLLKPPSWAHFEPLWVTDFPLFSPIDPSEPGQGGHAGIASTHHPFTSPKAPEDVDHLLSDPTRAIGDHYDLVINGEEIGGGSRRIHHAAMQDFVFREILKMDASKRDEFVHLLDALRSGCPPHAGIALGFDRLVAMVASSKLEKPMSMRDVIAFPKTGRGDDPMMQSPGAMTDEALGPYHLRLL